MTKLAALHQENFNPQDEEIQKFVSETTDAFEKEDTEAFVAHAQQLTEAVLVAASESSPHFCKNLVEMLKQLSDSCSLSLVSQVIIVDQASIFLARSDKAVFNHVSVIVDRNRWYLSKDKKDTIIKKR